MNKFWEKIEEYNKKIIPIAIVLLLFIIIFELFLHIENHTVELLVHIADIFVIIVFVIDLIFLAIHARSVKFFFKNYWLDIIAVFPFALFFTLTTKLYSIVITTERFIITQSILHESLEARKGVSALARTQKFARYLRIVARLIRIITKSRLFTHFGKKHKQAKKNWHKKPKKRK